MAAMLLGGCSGAALTPPVAGTIQAVAAENFYGDMLSDSQTVTPVTTNLQNEAAQNNIPLVPVSETMPAGKTYQTWMLDQLNALQLALGG